MKILMSNFKPTHINGNGFLIYLLIGQLYWEFVKNWKQMYEGRHDELVRVVVSSGIKHKFFNDFRKYSY